MKLFHRILSLVLAVLTVLALASCNAESDADGEKQNDKTDKVAALNATDAIKAAMEANNHLTTSNYFLAADGSVLVRESDYNNKQAAEYAKLANVKKLIAGAGLSAYALTESGEIYFENRKVAENVTMAAYCTTNVNVEGFCIINGELRRINSYGQLDDRSYNSAFKNYPSGEALSGEAVFIEVDKHDFIVLDSKGKFYTNWSSEAYDTLDFTGFEGLVMVDIAKHMDMMKHGVVNELTVAGIKADGTPVATGTYAEDILSWGKLADLAMNDGLIVGLTEDGKVKMTGLFAKQMKETVEGWTNIVAIEAGYATGSNVDNIVTALDSNGVFHYACIMNEYASDIATGTGFLDGITGDAPWRKYTPDGKMFYTDHEYKWVENTDE
ncbi:MAG: hypothetical protein IKL84_05635 [Clostridia bacterium]|nr:hypothetical protein [Clostridia bacterium]